ncbi:hypothetical protein NC652_011477 [Populus alba x Populus x berolinensis]|nr:hypothetical protein NC652_011477 [Populus alba x Populus x berolinensis]
MAVSVTLPTSVNFRQLHLYILRVFLFFLKDPADKRRILCDDKLKELFEVDSFSGFHNLKAPVISFYQDRTDHKIKETFTPCLISGNIVYQACGYHFAYRVRNVCCVENLFPPVDVVKRKHFSQSVHVNSCEHEGHVLTSYPFPSGILSAYPVLELT